MRVHVVSTTVLFGGLVAALLVSGSAMAQGIYTCVDSKGRRITSDRTIAECTDRTQQMITPNGTVQRTIGPTLTAQERTAQDAKDKALAEEKAQALEEKRRDRALLLRYPSRQVHDKERSLALAQVDEVIKTSSKRALELVDQRKSIDTELEFYKKDLSKMPPQLKRRIDENESNIAAQKRFVAEQELEKRRVNARFDDELVKLRQLWAMMGAPATSVSGTSGAGNSARN